MLTYRYPIIAREGWPLIGLVLIVTVAFTLFSNIIAALPLWLILLLAVFMYRDPPRKIPSTPLAIVAPVDGRIVAIDKAQDPFAERESTRLVIAMNLLGIYSARSPTEGKIVNQWHGSHATEQSALHLAVGGFAQWIQTDEGDDIVMVMRQRSRVQAPRCYAHSGERVGQGQRCGFVPLGAEVEVLIPASSRIDVKLGDTLRAGSDIIATLIRRPATETE
jgi:phosphatidylserine decarboxylase